MKVRFLSIILSFFLLFSSFSMTVNATQVDDPHWVPVGEELLNELYMLVNSWGIVFAPDVSLSDVISTSPTAGIGFRINPDSGVLEMDSLYRLRTDDGVTFPSEFIEGLKNIVKEYPQTKTGMSTQKEYAISEQVGIFNLKGYVRVERDPWAYDIYINGNVDTKYYKVFGVFTSYPQYGYDSIDIWTYSKDNKGLYQLSYPYDQYSYNKLSSEYKFDKSSNAYGFAYTKNYSLNIPVFFLER